VAGRGDVLVLVLFVTIVVAGSLVPLPVGETHADPTPGGAERGRRPPNAEAQLVSLGDFPPPPVHWRTSTVIGSPGSGRLERAVHLPYEGEHFFTYDGVLHRKPNRAWRRWGSDRLIGMLLGVLERYAAQHPGAPRVGIGDLSRPHGGQFGAEFGGRGHVSHQNGLDVDIFYPRLDRREAEPRAVGQIDRRLSQALVDLFVSGGAQTVYVGARTRLRAPPRVVRDLAFHDDHMHVRIGRRWPRDSGRAPLPIGE
jgi:murein endopeptidase